MDFVDPNPARLNIHADLRITAQTHVLSLRAEHQFEIGFAMTSTSPDRRLTVRVLRIWKKLAAGGMARRSQIDPMAFSTDWTNCLMIDLDKVPSRSRFSFVGNALRDPSWPTFDRQCISECLDGTLLELVTRHIPRVVARKKPISFGGPAIHDEADILYRTILLPLSENGEQVDGILAAIAYREVSVGQEIPVSDVPVEHDAAAANGAVRSARSAGKRQAASSVSDI